MNPQDIKFINNRDFHSLIKRENIECTECTECTEQKSINITELSNPSQNNFNSCQIKECPKCKKIKSLSCFTECGTYRGRTYTKECFICIKKEKEYNIVMEALLSMKEFN